MPQVPTPAMTLNWNIGLFFGFLFLQGLGPLFTGHGEAEVVYHALLGAMQGAVSLVAHHYTLDGKRLEKAPVAEVSLDEAE